MSLSQFFGYLYVVIPAIFIAGLLFFVSNAVMLKWDQVTWRRIKVFSVFFGSLSLGLTIIGFERASKSSFYSRSQQMAPFHLSDLRFEIAKDMIKICQSDTGAESQRDACSILNEVDISVRTTMFDKKPHVNLRSNWTHNPVVEPLMGKYKTLAGYANMYFDGMNREYDNINSEQSDKFYLLALLVLTFSASASVGESVYQYKCAQMDAAKKAKDTKINFIASLGKEI